MNSIKIPKSTDGFYWISQYFCITADEIMTVDIKTEKLKIVLRSIKNQHINVSIKNRFGRWSKEYYKIDDLHEIRNAEQVVALLVLQSGCSTCTVIDLNSIHGLRFNKFLNFDGHLIRELKVVFAPDLKPILHV